MKWVPFLLKVVYKRVKGLNLEEGEGGGGDSPHIILSSTPVPRASIVWFLVDFLEFFKTVEPNLVHDVETL